MAGSSRILSIATLIVHLMVGCCSHHAQGCESKDRSAATSDAAPDGLGPQCGCENSHHGTADCQGGKSSLASPRRTVAGSVIPRFQASFAALPDDQRSGVDIGSRERFRATGRLLMPVRLHLANQILLI
jgi:hypothetical protein